MTPSQDTFVESYRRRLVKNALDAWRSFEPLEPLRTQPSQAQLFLDHALFGPADDLPGDGVPEVAQATIKTLPVSSRDDSRASSDDAVPPAPPPPDKPQKKKKKGRLASLVQVFEQKAAPSEPPSPARSSRRKQDKTTAARDTEQDATRASQASLVQEVGAAPSNVTAAEPQASVRTHASTLASFVREVDAAPSNVTAAEAQSSERTRASARTLASFVREVPSSVTTAEAQSPVRPQASARTLASFVREVDAAPSNVTTPTQASELDASPSNMTATLVQEADAPAPSTGNRLSAFLQSFPEAPPPQRVEQPPQRVEQPREPVVVARAEEPPRNKLSAFVSSVFDSDDEPPPASHEIPIVHPDTPPVERVPRGKLAAFMNSVFDDSRGVSETKLDEPHQQEERKWPAPDAVSVAKSTARKTPIERAPARKLVPVAIAVRAAFRCYRSRVLAQRVASWRVTTMATSLTRTQLLRDDEAVVSSSSSVDYDHPVASSRRNLSKSPVLLMVLRRAQMRSRLALVRTGWNAWRKLGSSGWFDDEARLVHIALFKTHEARQRQLMLKSLVMSQCRAAKYAGLLRAWRRLARPPRLRRVRRTERPSQIPSNNSRYVRRPRSQSRRTRRPSDEGQSDSDNPETPRPLKGDDHVALGRATARLITSTLRSAFSTLRAHADRRALAMEVARKAAALARLEAAEFQTAELRQLVATAKDEFMTGRRQASKEVHAAWRQAAASQSGHAAQTAAFAALQTELFRMKAGHDAVPNMTIIATTDDVSQRRRVRTGLDERQRQIDALEQLLIDAKLEIASIRTTNAL